MASATTEPQVCHVVEEEAEEQKEQHGHRLAGWDHGVVAREAVSNKRVSRLAVEGGAGNNKASRDQSAAGGNHAVRGRRAEAGGAVRATLPPPHAWLAIDDMKKHKHSGGDPEAEQWARLLRGGGGGGDAGMIRQQQRRSSFCVVRRERAAREAWLDRAWEAKRSWHERNGGAPDADTPVVVVVGKAASPELSDHQHHHHQAGAVGGGGVAMDVEEVRACRDLGLELPSDCTVEIQCYGLSGGSSPTNTAASSGADSPCGVISSPGADPMDVKARLKVWAQAVALASTTHLGS